MKPRKNPTLPKATTFRLAPRIQEDLVILGKALKVPLNRLVNEALSTYSQNRIAELATNLEATLALLKSRRADDPDFESAISDFSKREAAGAKSDPAEGKIIVKRGAVQSRIHALLNA